MKHSSQIKLVLPVFMVLFLILLSACGGSDQTASTSSTTPAPNPTPSPTVEHTPASTPTSKPTIAPSTGPTVLGGTLGAFVAKFGQPNDHSSDGQPHLQRYPDSNIDYLILQQAPGQNSYSQTIASVTVQADEGKPWDITTAEANCRSFMPSDAVFQKRIDIAGSASQLGSFDMGYFSATLAKEFTADQFTDANQNPVKPGLFDINYLYNATNDFSHINSCSIQLSMQQTQ